MRAKVLVPIGLVVVVIVALLVLHPVFKRYKMPSESMEPTIALGDKFNADNGAYDDGGPAIGDIVLFHGPSGADAADGPCGARHPESQACPKPLPGQTKTLFVKRVVAGPGDRVAFKDSRVVRNGEAQSEPYIKPCETDIGCNYPKEIAVPDGMYFLAGDNRGASDDSRFYGPVPRAYILGRVERCHALYFACSPAG
jgi:signal peptidase I